jgi:hypothetical protein
MRIVFHFYQLTTEGNAINVDIIKFGQATYIIFKRDENYWWGHSFEVNNIVYTKVQ